MRVLILIWALLTGIFTTVVAAAPEPIRGVASVIDGDTLEISGLRIRLEGMDAPEREQPCTTQNGKTWPCGRFSESRLSELTAGHLIQCDAHALDQYGRTVAYCHVNGRDLGSVLVREGWAVAATRFSRRYVSEEEAARDQQIGIWSGAFEEPWQWRRQQAKGDRF